MKLIDVQSILNRKTKHVVGKRRAAVAMILRKPGCSSTLEDHLEDMEMFFMLRAMREGDRWQGQVAFPGGMQEMRENDLGTVIREVDEEIGFKLDSDDYVLVGRIHDRAIPNLVVAAFVFLQTSATTPEMHLEPSEVGACGWTPVRDLLVEDCAIPLAFSRGDIFAGYWGLPSRAACIVRRLGLQTCLFTGVDLKVNDLAIPKQHQVTEEDKKNATEAFTLWGMTLGVVNDLLADMTHIRKDRILLTQQFLGGVIVVDRAFPNYFHNLNYAMLRKMYKAVYKDHYLSLGQYIYFCVASFTGLGAASVASIPAVALSSKL